VQQGPAPFVSKLFAESSISGTYFGFFLATVCDFFAAAVLFDGEAFLLGAAPDFIGARGGFAAGSSTRRRSGVSRVRLTTRSVAAWELCGAVGEGAGGGAAAPAVGTSGLGGGAGGADGPGGCALGGGGGVGGGEEGGRAAPTFPVNAGCGICTIGTYV
jgi:hypothetical protein